MPLSARLDHGCASVVSRLRAGDAGTVTEESWLSRFAVAVCAEDSWLSRFAAGEAVEV
jgi:hypothetical protein